ncbi:hypothetical protein KUTeg_006366, partial [Tegillarca granosa]
MTFDYIFLLTVLLFQITLKSFLRQPALLDLIIVELSISCFQFQNFNFDDKDFSMSHDFKMVFFILCLISVADSFLVDDNDHLILIQMNQELDLLKTQLAQVKADQQATQTDSARVKSEKQTAQNELSILKTELDKIKANTQQNKNAIGHQIVFDTVHLNKGNGYNNRHGIFLAPVNGTYHFTLEITYAPNPTHDHNTGVYLKKRSENIAYTYSIGTWENLIRRSTSAIVELVAGDD